MLTFGTWRSGLPLFLFAASWSTSPSFICLPPTKLVFGAALSLPLRPGPFLPAAFESADLAGAAFFAGAVALVDGCCGHCRFLDRDSEFDTRVSLCKIKVLCLPSTNVNRFTRL